jgi:thiol:disulfide interchange protein
VFIDFYTNWCAPCKVMEQSVFRDEDVANYLNDNCISIRVNAEKGKGPDRKLEYAVDAYPTMLVYNPNGDEVARKQGSLGIEAFKEFIKSAVWKAKNP